VSLKINRINLENQLALPKLFQHYRLVLVGQSYSDYQREVCVCRPQPPRPGEVSISSRVPPSDETLSRKAEEGWQLVKPRRKRPWSVKQPEDKLQLQVEWHAHYLSKVRDLCFNCLAPGHKVNKMLVLPSLQLHLHEVPLPQRQQADQPLKVDVPELWPPHTHSLHHPLCSQPDQSLVMMLDPRMLEEVKDNKTDPMCEDVGLMLLPKIKKSITRPIPVSSTTTNEGQELFKVAPLITTVPQLMVATLEMLNIEQKSKTVVEENSILAKDVFPNQNTM
jgi:hypothetical protein